MGGPSVIKSVSGLGFFLGYFKSRLGLSVSVHKKPTILRLMRSYMSMCPVSSLKQNLLITTERVERCVRQRHMTHTHSR